MTMRPSSLVALVIAGGVSLSLVALSIGAAWTEAGGGTGQLSTESSALLSTALGAAIGAVATYLGVRSGMTPPGEASSPDELPDRWPPSKPYNHTEDTSEYPTREIPPEQ